MATAKWYTKASLRLMDGGLNWLGGSFSLIVATGGYRYYQNTDQFVSDIPAHHIINRYSLAGMSYIYSGDSLTLYADDVVAPAGESYSYRTMVIVDDSNNALIGYIDKGWSVNKLADATLTIKLSGGFLKLNRVETPNPVDGAFMSSFYRSGIEGIVTGDIQIMQHTIKAALLDVGYTPDFDAHTQYADLTNEVVGGGYTAGGAVVGLYGAYPNINFGTAAAVASWVPAYNPEWTSSTFYAFKMALYDDDAAGKPLIACYPFSYRFNSVDGTYEVNLGAIRASLLDLMTL